MPPLNVFLYSTQLVPRRRRGLTVLVCDSPQGCSKLHGSAVGASRQLSPWRQKAVPPHRGRGGRAAQACLCSQMAVQLISSVNRPCCQQRDRMRERMTTPTQNPTTPRHQEPRRTIHSIPESQGCLVLLCPGWSTTLCADGSRSTLLFINLP